MALIKTPEVDFKKNKVTEKNSDTPNKRKRLLLPKLDDDDVGFVVERSSEPDRSARVHMTASKILMPSLRGVLNENKDLWSKSLEQKEQVEAILIPCSKICMSTLSTVNDLRKELEIRGLDVVNVKDQWPLRRLIQYVSLLNEQQKDRYGSTDNELTLAVFRPIFDSYNQEKSKQVIDTFDEYKIKYDSDLMLLNKIITSTVKISCGTENNNWLTNNGHCVTDLVDNLVKITCENLRKHNLTQLSKDVQRQLICRTINDVQSLQMQSYEYEKEIAKNSENKSLPVFPANLLADKLSDFTGFFRGVQGKLVDLVHSILAKGNEYIVNIEENKEWSKRMNFLDILFPVIEASIKDKNLTIEDKVIAIEKSIDLSSAIYTDVLAASNLKDIDGSASKHLLNFSVKVLCNTVRSAENALEAPKVYVNYVSALAKSIEVQDLLEVVSTVRGVPKDNVASALISAMFPLMQEISKFNYFEANRPTVVCEYAVRALKHVKDGRVLSQLSNSVEGHVQGDISVIGKELLTVFSYYNVVRERAFNDVKEKLDVREPKERLLLAREIESKAKEDQEEGKKTKAIDLVDLSERFFISRLPLFSSAIRQFTNQLRDELDVELDFMNKKNNVKGMP